MSTLPMTLLRWLRRFCLAWRLHDRLGYAWRIAWAKAHREEA
jgi:hypothetical protein